MSSLKDEIGRAIKDRRQRLGISQADLATKAGLHPKHVYRLETGRSENPRLENLEKIAKALGTTPVELFGGERSNSEPSPTRQLLQDCVRSLGDESCELLLGIARTVLIPREVSNKKRRRRQRE